MPLFKRRSAAETILVGDEPVREIDYVEPPDATARRRQWLARFILLIVVLGIPSILGFWVGPAQAGAALVYGLIGALIVIVLGVGTGWKKTPRQKATIDLSLAVLLLFFFSYGFQQNTQRENARSQLNASLAESYAKYQANEKALGAKVVALDLQNVMTVKAIVDPETRQQSISKIEQYRLLLIADIPSFSHYIEEVKLLTQQSNAPDDYKASTIANADAHEATQLPISTAQTGKVLKLLDAEDALLQWGAKNQGHLQVANGMVMYDTELLGAEFASLQADYIAKARLIGDRVQ